MTALPSLAPCPFCGGKATPDVEDNGSGTFWIVCDNVSEGCGCEGPYQHSEADAIAAWNRRTAPAGDDGIDRAIAFIRTRLDDYVSEHGIYDPSTGVTEFPGNGDETVGEWEEIIEGLEGLRRSSPSLPTQEDVARVIERLRGYADDPMWAEHAEVPKTLVRAAILALMGPTGQPGAGPSVASIVPPHCAGSYLCFVPGLLRVNKDGSGYISVPEDAWELEDDRDEGSDGPEGSVHWITRLSPSEMTTLRDFLNGAKSEPGDGWLPIERAPRNETTVDLWVRPHDAFANGNAGRIANCTFIDGSWMRLTGERLVPVSDCGVPTHYRPLPAPPAKEGR